MRAVEVGCSVIGFDVSQDRVEQLQRAVSYVEDITNERLNSAVASGRYVATTDVAACAGFDIAVITVPTPLREGSPDLSFIEDAAKSIAPLVTAGSTVILESTTYPGTTEELLVPILEHGSGLRAGTEFHVGYSPERIDPGNQTWSFERTPKVVSGITPESVIAVNAFYSMLVEHTVPVNSTKVAEMAKLLENTFRHVNIALVNELAMFAGELGVDIWETIEAAASKPFGFMKFTPGPGVGGHCLPVDPSYLSWKVKRSIGHSFRFVELANDINEHMPDYVVGRIAQNLNRSHKSLNGSKVLVLGLSYKRNSSDMRESPSAVLCEMLSASGVEVTVADPIVGSDLVTPWQRIELSPDSVRAADLVVIVTDHDQFDYAMVADNATQILDTRHRMAPGANVEFL
jgi:UDP-N-acetyl-D-glucosamine dehydrogenase